MSDTDGWGIFSKSMTKSFSWSAILLAGGKSTRMGRDKATLEINGLPLWKKQWKLLSDLSPDSLFRSLCQPVHWGSESEPVIWDLVDQGGPLVGIYSSLKKVSTPYCMILAVDLPNMELEYLTRLLAIAKKGRCGVVPQHLGLFEPLVAIYPKQAIAFMEPFIQSKHFVLQDLIKVLREQRLVQELEIEPASRKFFENWNQPSDVCTLQP